jgi:hypothetical protein
VENSSKRPIMERTNITFAAAVVLTMLNVVAPVFAGSSGLPTRFGTLSIDKANVLHYNGRPVRPRVRGNNNLVLNHVFRLASADIVVFEDAGGTACPDLWYIVTVSRSGASATPEFGSCGELIALEQKDDAIIVSTRGFQGPFEPAAARARAATQEHVFVFRHGTVKEGPVSPAP